MGGVASAPLSHRNRNRGRLCWNFLEGHEVIWFSVTQQLPAQTTEIFRPRIPDFLKPFADWNLSSTELEPGNPLGAFLQTQPQYWIKFLDPWVHDFYPVPGWSSAPSQRESAPFFPVPALDKNRSPNLPWRKVRDRWGTQNKAPSNWSIRITLQVRMDQWLPKVLVYTGIGPWSALLWSKLDCRLQPLGLSCTNPWVPLGVKATIIGLGQA